MGENQERQWVTNIRPGDITTEHRREFTEGPPHATETFSSKELKGMGLVGLYRREAE